MKEPRSVCETVEHKSLAGEILSGEDRAHVSGCARCRDSLSLVRAVSRASRALAERSVPAPDESPALEAAVRARLGEPVRRRRLLWLGAPAVAAAAAALVWTMVVRTPAPPPEPAPGPEPAAGASAEASPGPVAGGETRRTDAPPFATASPTRPESAPPDALVWLDLAEPAETPLESLLPEPYRWLLLALESRSL